jgi:uncharacterized membrane protein
VQKYWPFIALLVFLLLIAPLFLWPEVSNLVALAVLLLALVMSYIFIVRRNLQAQDQMTPTRIIAKTLLQLLVVLVVVAAASLVGFRVGAWLGLIAAMLSVFGVLWIMSRV